MDDGGIVVLLLLLLFIVAAAGINELANADRVLAVVSLLVLTFATDSESQLLLIFIFFSIFD
jgi:hypothetical protein